MLRRLWNILAATSADVLKRWQTALLTDIPGCDPDVVKAEHVAFYKRVFTDILQSGDARSEDIESLRNRANVVFQAGIEQSRLDESLFYPGFEKDFIAGHTQCNPHLYNAEEVQEALDKTMGLDMLRAFKVYDVGIAIRAHAVDVQTQLHDLAGKVVEIVGVHKEVKEAAALAIEPTLAKDVLGLPGERVGTCRSLCDRSFVLVEKLTEKSLLKMSAEAKFGRDPVTAYLEVDVNMVGAMKAQFLAATLKQLLTHAEAVKGGANTVHMKLPAKFDAVAYGRWASEHSSMGAVVQEVMSQFDDAANLARFEQGCNVRKSVLEEEAILWKSAIEYYQHFHHIVGDVAAMRVQMRTGDSSKEKFQGLSNGVRMVALGEEYDFGTKIAKSLEMVRTQIVAPCEGQTTSLIQLIQRILRVAGQAEWKTDATRVVQHSLELTTEWKHLQNMINYQDSLYEVVLPVLPATLTSSDDGIYPSTFRMGFVS